MVGKKEYTQYFRMIPYIQPGDIRDAVVKESKKVRTPNPNVKNITPNTQPKTFKQVESDQLKALKEANKEANDSLKATVMAFKAHISDNNLRIKESAENIATIRLAEVRANRAINLDKYVNQNKAETHKTTELGRRATFSADEKIRVDKEKATTVVEKAINLVAVAVSKDVQLAQNRINEKQSSADIKVKASQAINLDRYTNQTKADTHRTTELGRRVSFASDEKIRVDTEKAITTLNKTIGLATIAVSKNTKLSQIRINEKQASADIKVKATRETILDRFVVGKEAATHMTSELAQRAKVSTDEKIRLDTEKATTAFEKALNLAAAAVLKDIQITQNHTEALKDRLEIKKAYRKEREEEKKQADAARSLKRQKDKELNKYNGMSLPGIAHKYLSEEIQIGLTNSLGKLFTGLQGEALTPSEKIQMAPTKSPSKSSTGSQGGDLTISEKIQTSLAQGLGKIFTGSQGKALTSSLGKSIIAGVSTAASGAILTAVAAGAAALVALMIAPFKLILSFSQKAFNFLKGIATQTETFKKLMELVMMPFMLMFTLLFAPVLMALAPLLATVIQTIASKQDAIMAVGAKIGLVIEKLFDDKMIETYIALIDQVIGAIDWFVDVVKDNLTFGNSIFETIVLTFTKVMSQVLVEITRWASGPEGTGIINELGTLIGTMIGITAAFVISLLPAIFSALEPSIKGIFEGVMQFISDLFIAGIRDTLGVGSGVVAIIKDAFTLIGEILGAAAAFLAWPTGAFMNINDTIADIADIGKSFGDLMGSMFNYNNDNRVSNIDNTHFNFDISAGAGAGNLIDELTASLKLNGVI